MKESAFGNRVKSFLDQMPKTFAFKKEAMAIRGIPDIIACINGRYVALELKKDKHEASKKAGRIKLQRYTIEKIEEAGGLGFFVYPENWNEIKKALLKLTA